MMISEDILNFVNFKSDVEQLLNNYIARGFSATAMIPTIREALEALNSFSEKEIKQAKETQQIASQINTEPVIEEDPTSETTDYDNVGDI